MKNSMHLKLPVCIMVVLHLDLDIFVPAPAHWYRMGDGDSSPTLIDSIGDADLTMNNMGDANFVTEVPS